MKEKNVFLDLDGVILDSEKRVKDLISKANPQKEIEWQIFFDNIDWKTLLKESKSINKSVEIIQELEKLKKQIIILTKIHSLKEMQAKVLELRENRKINFPIMFVPQHTRKTQIYIPNNNEILVDDSQKNINDWNINGGNGVLFEESCTFETATKVKSLEFLLRKR